MFSAHALFCSLDLPGFKKEDISINIDNNVLTVSAFKKECHLEEAGVHYYRRERAWGKTFRSLRLPSNIGADSATCDFVNGVLIVTLPKVASSTHKHLTIV